MFECVNVWLFGSDMCCNMQGSRCSAAWYGVASANACRYRQTYMYCIDAVSHKHGLIRMVQKQTRTQVVTNKETSTILGTGY